MLQAEKASGGEKAVAEAQAVDLILRLWARRRDAPGNFDPLREFEGVLSVLRLLKARTWSFGRSGRTNLQTLLIELFSVLQAMVAHAAVLTGNPTFRKVDAGEARAFQTPEEREIIDVINEWITLAEADRERSDDIRIVIRKNKAEEEREAAEIRSLLQLNPQQRARVMLSRQIDELTLTLSALKSELESPQDETQAP